MNDLIPSVMAQDCPKTIDGTEHCTPFNFRITLGISFRGQDRQDRVVGGFRSFIDAYNMYNNLVSHIHDSDCEYDIVLFDHYVADGGYRNYSTFLMFSLDDGEYTPS